MARKEDNYIAALTSLGVYDPAFDAEIHQLCVLERELSRAMKEWKATATPEAAPSVLDPCYDVVCRLRRDILAHRDALGLTPKGVQRLRRSSASPGADGASSAAGGNAALAALLDGIRLDTHGGGA